MKFWEWYEKEKVNREHEKLKNKIKMFNGTQNPLCEKNDYGLLCVFFESVFYTGIPIKNRAVQYSTQEDREDF